MEKIHEPIDALIIPATTSNAKATPSREDTYTNIVAP